MANVNLDLDDLGRRIEGIVDRAVSSHDYQKLNYTIRQMVEKAVDVGNEAVRRVSDSTMVTELRQNNSQLPVKRLYGKTGGRTAGGIVKTVIGGEITLFGTVAVILSLVWGSLFEAGINAAFLSGGIALMTSGIRSLAQLSRFRKYKKVLGDQTHCSVARLAQRVGKNEKFVRKDLWRMISKGYFLEGHMDNEEKTLITSNETFKFYEQSRLAYEERKRLQEPKPAPVPAPARKSDPVPLCTALPVGSAGSASGNIDRHPSCS